MPAKSQKQQAAAAIALKARKDGTVEKLPKKSASYQMATSMTMKELEKMASTKRKNLPKSLDEDVITDEMFDELMNEMMVNEEMLGLNDEDGQITTQKSKSERLKAYKNDRKDYKDAWANSVPPVANSTRSPMTTNTRGTRVAESIVQNSLDILFEEYNDWDYERKDDQREIAKGEIQSELVEQIENSIIKPVVELLEFLQDKGDKISKDLAVDAAWDELEDFLSANGEHSKKAQMLFAEYEDRVPHDTPDNLFEKSVKEAIAVELGKRAWEKFKDNDVVTERWQRLAGILCEEHDEDGREKLSEPESTEDEGLLSDCACDSEEMEEDKLEEMEY